MAQDVKRQKVLMVGFMNQEPLDRTRESGVNIYTRARSYFPPIDDPEIECTLSRAQSASNLGARSGAVAGPDGGDGEAPISALR